MNRIRRALRLTRARLIRQRLRAMPWDVRLFRRRLRGRVPRSDVRSGPLVSIVLVEPRAEVLARRLAALDRTTYRPIEVILIADADPSMAEATPSPSLVVRSVAPPVDGDRRPAFAAAVDAAEGEFICIVDGAVEPVLDDWLGHLVERVMAGSVAAAPLLIRPGGAGLVRARQQTADLTVLSAGIDLERSNGVITPRHLGVGRPYRWDPSEPYRDVPAASLACILMRRSDLIEAGGVPGGYDRAGAYTGAIPFADVDLGSGLRAGGGGVTVDRRVLAWCWYDDPLQTPIAKPSKDLRAAWETTGERARFIDRWGPRLARQVLGDAVTGAHDWTLPRLRVARIGETRLPALANATDWHVIDARPDGPWSGKGAVHADVVVTNDPQADIREAPSGQVRVAWVTTTGPQHLDDFDIVVAATDADRDRIADTTSKRISIGDLDGAGGGALLQGLLCDWLAARRIGIRIGPSKWRNAFLWGDFHFARALQRYLERAGLPTRVRLIVDWASTAAAMDDATLHLFGNQQAHNRPAQVNVLWQISHPDLASGEMYDTYDHAFVASDRFADRMAGQARIPVEPLHQATDTERFFPDPTGPHHELLFVANYRPERHIVEWLVPTERDLAIYGRAWDEHGLDARYLRGSHIPNAELRGHYASASIVLNDTWADMRSAGFISNRIYDALASGAFVLSDDVQGMDEEFDGGVAIYRDADDLRSAVDRYLDAPELRREIAERGRAAVLARHTFERRAEEILAAMRPLLDARPAWVSESSSTPSPRPGHPA